MLKKRHIQTTGVISILMTWLFLSLPVMAAQGEPAATKAALSPLPPQASSELIKQDLQHFLPNSLPESQLKHLSDNTTVLWHDYNSAQHKGVAILVPDWGMSPTTPKQINHLRTRLTRIGFDTLALLPPEPQLPVTKTQAANNQAPKSEQQTKGNKKEQNALQSSSNYKTHLLKQLKQIEQETLSIPGFKLILAQGTNSAWLAELYLKKELTAPDAMILLDAYYPEPSINQQMAQTLSELRFPLLDIKSSQANQWQKKAMQQRENVMQKQVKLDYRQQELVFDLNEDKLYKSIYGWLSSLGWY